MNAVAKPINKGQREPYRVGLSLVWNLMDESKRKAMLIIIGMSAEESKKTGEYKRWPNANFYKQHNFEMLPDEWRHKVYSLLIQMERE
jgi:hypothetical protein